MSGLSYSDAPRVVLVNNSEETYTPTNSGAIATWIWEVSQVAEREGVPISIITQSATVDPYPGDHLSFVPRTALSDRQAVAIGQRALRRGFAWRTVGLGSYIGHVLMRLSGEPPGTVVVCHNDPELATVLARTLRQLHVVHWFHNPILVADRWRRSYRRAPIRSVAVSRAVARSVELLYELPASSVDVVLNGVDLERFRPRAGRPRRGGTVTIGFVGRTGREKGLDVLLEACLSVAAEQRFALQVVGANHWGAQVPDAYQHELQVLFDRLSDVGFPVARLGHIGRSDLPDALRDTDIHVVPSRWDEPCSLSLLEGMATGLAVVATATGGSPELVGSAGLLIPRDDAPALADALRSLLDDDLRTSLAQGARRQAERRRWADIWQAVVAVAAATND